MPPDRFFALLLALRPGRPLTTEHLADQLGVSVRTVLRDLNWLRDAGFPLVVQRGRHGGVTLLPGGPFDIARLTPADRDHLALAGLDDAQRAALGVAAEGERVRRKMRLGPRRSPDGLLPLSAVVVPDSRPWSAHEPPPDSSPAALVHDVRRGVRLRIRYRHSHEDRPRWRVVDPYGLLAKAGTWYLVADHDRRPHLYRLDRVTSWRALDSPRRLRPGATLADVAADLVETWKDTHTYRVEAAIDPAQLPRAGRILGHRLTPHPGAPGGRIPVTIALRTPEDIRILLQFGSSLTVTAPPQARTRLHELGTEIAQLYSSPGTRPDSTPPRGSENP
ncbi:helix-turn-helix transcriptional regulator [Nocardia farcinica]|uniref:helix-turn-helix transcriptional regulator n=1 Tax=Nocardia farcinica TaxID=37329 RepID=UPI002454E7E8|nr:WYL domain-containing protein [Nocardia farcinica]